MNKTIVIRLGWSLRKRGKRAQKALFYSSLTARNVPRGLIDWHTEQFLGSFFWSKMGKKKWKKYFFWKSAVIGALFEKNTKMPKSPHWRVFLVLRKPKKLGQRSLKRWFLTCFDVFSNIGIEWSLSHFSALSSTLFLNFSWLIQKQVKHCIYQPMKCTKNLESAEGCSFFEEGGGKEFCKREKRIPGFRTAREKQKKIICHTKVANYK